MVCRREYEREYRRKQNSRAPGNFAIKRAKSRAKIKGIPFTLTAADIPPLPKKCPIIGIPLSYRDDGEAGATPNSPSLDRIIPELGYVPGNVRWVSYRGNLLKNNASIEELELVLADARRLASPTT
jgi:hypothetical protein